MSSLFRLRLRATNSFSAACCSPTSATVRSYSGPNSCFRRSVRLRRPAEAATISPPMAIKTRAAMKNHAHTGISHSFQSWLIRGDSMRSVIVATAADRAAARSQNRQNDAGDEQDDPNDQEDVREGESRYEAGQDEPEDDEDDAEEDHKRAFRMWRWMQRVEKGDRSR